MTVEQLFFYQLIAYLLTEISFPYNNKKEKKDSKKRIIVSYLVIPFVLSWIFSFQLYFAGFALIIALPYVMIKMLKKRIETIPFLGKYSFFLYQALHLIVIVISVLVYDKYFVLDPLIVVPLSIHKLSIIAAFLFCTKPANDYIGEIIKIFNVQVEKNKKGDELPNAGKLIGIVERFLVLIFILFSQYQAIGLLIAAKSILRFKEDDTIKAEYVLVGTMLSFAIALILGVAITFHFGVIQP